MQAYVIRAIMTRITGKETVCLYCVPFGTLPYSNMLRKSTTLPTKLAEDRRRTPQGKRIINKQFTLPVITTCKAATYKRIGITYVPRK